MAVRSKSKARTIAVNIVKATSETDRELLQRWGQSLLEIKRSDGSTFNKAKRTLQVSAKSDSLIPLVKLLAKETQRLGWEERGLPARIAIAAAIAALVTTGGSGAGIAALGGAIGVPLWIVFGAGGAFLGVLLEELRKSRLPSPAKKQPKRTGNPASKRLARDEEIIDVDFVEVPKEGKRSVKPKPSPVSKAKPKARVKKRTVE